MFTFRAIVSYSCEWFVPHFAGTKMLYVWCLAASVIGLGLGLHIGRIFTAIVAYWESSQSTVSAIKVIFNMCLAGGGAALFGTFLGQETAAFYFLGFGAGAITGFFLKLPSRWVLQDISAIIHLSDSCGLKNLDAKARFVYAILVPPSVILQQKTVSEDQLEKDLESGADE